MTTTSLYIGKMTSTDSMQTIKQLLNEAGFATLSISIGKVRVSAKPISKDDIIRIKHKLSRKGFKLLSISETTWPSNAIQLK